ncbi:hypothetical protein F5X68DRAFT_216749 [Plectosphaerella plurivora]|uniref:Uncharacterized protein n=1 Tax=Plectosphaerella plurivora TaxID=936078 RepID=A0A9P9A7F0_9PEZI|nr:hypothetical protein F5X68DRAFT_216749 [Plectosphaerella plurivora]
MPLQHLGRPQRWARKLARSAPQLSARQLSPVVGRVLSASPVPSARRRVRLEVALQTPPPLAPLAVPQAMPLLQTPLHLALRPTLPTPQIRSPRTPPGRRTPAPSHRPRRSRRRSARRHNRHSQVPLVKLLHRHLLLLVHSGRRPSLQPQARLDRRHRQLQRVPLARQHNPRTPLLPATPTGRRPNHKPTALVVPRRPTPSDKLRVRPSKSRHPLASPRAVLLEARPHLQPLLAATRQHQVKGLDHTLLPQRSNIRHWTAMQERT